MDLTQDKRAAEALASGAGGAGYPPQELVAALLTLEGAALTSGEVEELRRACLDQGGAQESPGGTSPAGAR